MKKLTLSVLFILFSSSILYAQEHKNELGMSIFSLETYEPGHFDFGIGGYINPLNAIIYKRALSEDIKLRGILTAEINASSYPGYRDQCNDCGSFNHTANSIGISGGTQFGRTYNKFSPYGYVDLFYKYKYETVQYTNPWAGDAGQYSKDINSFGLRVGFGLEYNFSDRLSIALEPSLSVAYEVTNGDGYSSVHSVFTELEWDNTRETSVLFRGVNVLSVNVKF